ncbi:putative salicylate hydroxylase [Aspergillus lucknowensis]|uniref:FAD-binding domain-containing protein n=1 Tax=Aspergillus lucknowensis TaxID=176173 RepID=A0ABR4LTV5_9EURO
MASAKQFTVAIIGGGIGGLSLAAGLLRRNVPVQIYEAAAEFKEIGLGLTIGPAAHRAMPLIDPQIRSIYDELITTHADSPGFERFRETWFEVVWATGPEAGSVLMDLKALPSGQTTVRRADFLDALVKLIPPGIARFGKRLVSLWELAGEDEEEEEGGVELQFEDGTVATADVVVGCDGIHSRVKQAVLPEDEYNQTQPRYSGMYGYRAVLDMETMVEAVGEHRARVATMYIGDGAYAISYPIMRAKKANVGIFPLNSQWDGDGWARPARKEDMRRDLAHMGEQINSLIEHMPDPSQWAIYEHPHISTYARSRIAILGDAAHASTPHQGAGAGQAIEDAIVLAELLGDPRVVTADHVVAAFQAYDAVRRPRSQRAVASSAEGAHLLCLRLEGVGDDGEKLKQEMKKRLHWLWNLNVQGHVEEARALMLGRIQQ